ncbi:MAG: hypothetical protein JRI23_14960 [Deltaproteobacteria bacterium]|nr:hypothetical protein [Deltaproteobacteria bacterium]MBW2533050.1 hypothetical protein [Deltaproteobacteria bacterium]
MVLLSNGQVLVTGGCEVSPNTSAKLYDPSTNRWSAQPDMPPATVATPHLRSGPGRAHDHREPAPGVQRLHPHVARGRHGPRRGCGALAGYAR